MKGAADVAQKTLGVPPSGVGSLSKVVEAGKVIARVGATIGTVSGVFDVLASMSAAQRTGRKGDDIAKRKYLYASALYGAGTCFATFAAIRGSTAILSAVFGLGPAGWAILLGTAAYAIWKSAEEEESSPLERWALYSYFGKAKGELKWPDANAAVAALNAAVLGVDGLVKFTSGLRVEHDGGMAAAMGGMEVGLGYVPQLEYQVVLPNFDSSRAGYHWKLTATRFWGSEVLASGSHQFIVTTSKVKEKRRTRLDYAPVTATPTVMERTTTAADGSKTNFLLVNGKIALGLSHDVTKAEVEIQYLPNVNDPAMLAKVKVTEIG